MSTSKLFLGVIASSSIILFSIIGSASALADTGKPDDWGDLGYSKPVPEVESIANTAADDAVSSVALNQSIDGANTVGAEEPVSIKSNSERVATSNVSTVQNTFGVVTEEKPPLKLYVSPFAGMSSGFGNTTVSVDPNYAAGATVGLLISGNMSLEASYVHAEQGVSAVRSGSVNINIPMVGDVYTLKQNEFDLGVKLFYLGRESKFRPYFGGGFGYVRNALNYQSVYAQTALNQGYTSNDFMMNQVTGFGEVGLEFAFTKMIVANAMVKVDGVLSSNSSFDDNLGQQDFNRVTAGNSLSHTASYTLAAGLGFYF